MHSTALILLAAGAGAGAYARRVLVAPHAEAHIASAACAQSAYRGTFASSYSVYEDCSVHGVPQYSLDDDQALFHVQPAGVDQSVAGAGWSFASELESLLSSRTARKNDQVVLEGHWIQVLHATDAGALLAVRRSHIRELDAALPPYLALVALSQGPVPVSSTSAEEEHLADVLDGLEFSGAVASVLGALSVTQMHSDITWLSGEDTASPIWSRHSFTDGALVAADWLQARFEESGARCNQTAFLDGFAPNVVCEYAAANASAPAYVLGAHYDSRGSWGSTRAPGADDDGSGTTQLLAIARAIRAAKVRFHAPVRLVAFAGEEQGLLGSRAYAKALREQGESVALMIQADMLAFHHPSEPMQLGLPATIHAPIASYLVGNVSALYAPELSVGTTAACCSDHQSFVEAGYPATQVFERAGPIVDPMYHNSGDLVNRTGYDLEQVHSIAKVTFATILHAAGYDIAE